MTAPSFYSRTRVPEAPLSNSLSRRVTEITYLLQSSQMCMECMNVHSRLWFLKELG